MNKNLFVRDMFEALIKKIEEEITKLDRYTESNPAIARENNLQDHRELLIRQAKELQDILDKDNN